MAWRLSKNYFQGVPVFFHAAPTPFHIYPVFPPQIAINGVATSATVVAITATTVNTMALTNEQIPSHTLYQNYFFFSFICYISKSIIWLNPFIFREGIYFVLFFILQNIFIFKPFLITYFANVSAIDWRLHIKSI